jgi:hypothetical protein
MSIPLMRVKRVKPYVCCNSTKLCNLLAGFFCVFYVVTTSTDNSSKKINLLVFIMGMDCVHCEVRSGFPYFTVRSGQVRLTYNRPRRAQMGSRRIALLILDLGARRGWVVSTTPRPLYPWEKPGTHCTGGWVGPRAGLDVCEKSRPHRDLIPGPSSP